MTDSIYKGKNGEYLKNNPTWHSEDSKWKAGQIFKILENNHINPKSVVEVGCGAGEILNQLHALMTDNVDFTGFDISPDAIEIAKPKEKNGLSFKCKDFLKTEKKTDLLLLIDVFEHIEDYLGFLKTLKGRAKNTVFHIPLDISVQSVMRNRLIYGRKKVGHLHHFMKDTAIATLIDAGYEVIDSFYTPSLLDLPSRSFLTKMAVLPRRLFYKINKDFTVKLLGGFSLMVLAK